MIRVMNPPLEVKVPHENVNDPTAKLLLWKVPSGAKVSEGDAIAELENSKATFEITAPASGVVEYSRPVGQAVPVGETVPLARARLLENRELLAADRAALKSTVFYPCPAALQDAAAGHSPPVSRLVILLYETVKLLTKFKYLNACFVDDSAFLYRHIH